ncbi:MAG: hypothetical protein ACRDJV_05645 [Actinomycetota bacterium]
MLEAFTVDVGVEPAVLTPPGSVRAAIAWRCLRDCELRHATAMLEAKWEYVISRDGLPGAGSAELKWEVIIHPDGSTEYFRATPGIGTPVLPAGSYTTGQEGHEIVTMTVPWVHPTVEIRNRLTNLHSVRVDVTSEPGGVETYRAPVTLLLPGDGYSNVTTTEPVFSGPDLGLRLEVPERSIRCGAPVRGNVALARTARSVRVALVRSHSWDHEGTLGGVVKQMRADFKVDDIRLDAEAGAAHSFRLEVPDDAPPTCIPPHHSLRWFVRAEAPTGVWPFRNAAEVELELVVYNGDH